MPRYRHLDVLCAAYPRGYTYGAEGEPETTPDTPMRVASVSKSITAVAVMRLLEEQPMLSLDMPVFDVDGMPQPVGYDDVVFDITIRDLLRHTCGWGGGPLGRSPAQMAVDLGGPPLQFNGLSMYPRSQLVRYGLNTDAIHGDPAVVFGFDPELVGNTEVDLKYSNFGFMLLAELVEAVSGVSYEGYVGSRILEPLGMSSTHFAATNRFDVPAEEPIYSGDGAYLGDVNDTGNGEVQPSRFGLFTNAPSIVPTQYGGEVIHATADGSDGWVSTARDLLRFLIAFDQVPLGMASSGGEQILTPQSVSTMWAAQIEGLGATYALGWQRSTAAGEFVNPGDPDARYHGGNQAGSFSMIYHWARSQPANKLNVVMLLNRNRLTYNTARDKFSACLMMDAPGAPPVDGLGVAG